MYYLFGTNFDAPDAHFDKSKFFSAVKAENLKLYVPIANNFFSVLKKHN
jgi:hypothetical protein